MTAGAGFPTAGLGGAGTVAPGAGAGGQVPLGGSMATAGVGVGTAGTTPMGGQGGMAGAPPAGGMSGMMATAGTGGMEGTAGAGGTGGAPPAGPMMPCASSGTDVLVLGDSYVSYLNPLVPPLEAKAMADGQLPTGGYNDQAVPGTVIQDISNSWTANKGTNPKFVVMDGGGNDVLIGAPQCLAEGADQDPSCQAVVANSVAVGEAMIADMKASGVKGGIYFFYPHIPAGGHDVLDYSIPFVKESCEGASDANFKCVFVDTRMLFEGHSDYFIFDGIHPSASGAEALAGLIWMNMKQNCIGQTSGCCM